MTLDKLYEELRGMAYDHHGFASLLLYYFARSHAEQRLTLDFLGSLLAGETLDRNHFQARREALFQQHLDEELAEIREAMAAHFARLAEIESDPSTPDEVRDDFFGFVELMAKRRRHRYDA